MSPAAGRRSKSSLLRILGAVGFVTALAFVLVQQANFLAGRSLLIAFGNNDATYRSAWWEWDGDVVARDFELLPGGDASAAIRFEKVHVETPGWFWFARNLLARKLGKATLDRIHVTLSGGRTEAGVDPSLGDLGPFGASASPFEAEGCMSDSLWSPEELEAMGLRAGPMTLEFDHRIEGEQLLTRVVLSTANVSRVQLDRVGRLASGSNALVLDLLADETLSERWEVQDLGFASARNRYCAKKDGIDVRRFLERHVDSVARLMEMYGVGLDADSRAVYRRFARDGGSLSLSLEYPRPLPGAMLYDLRGDGRVLAASRARLDHDGRVADIRWRQLEVRPLPAWEQGEPTYPALAAELSARVAATGPADESAAIAGGLAATTSSESARASGPAKAPAAQSTQADAAMAVPAAPGAAARPDAEATIAPAVIASTGVPEADADQDAQASPEPDATAPAQADTTTEPPSAAKPRVDRPSSSSIAAPTPSGPRPGQRLEWSDLPRFEGRFVRIWTMHNPPRTVELLSSEGGVLRVKARLGGGHAEYTVNREGFLRATLIR